MTVLELIAVLVPATLLAIGGIFAWGYYRSPKSAVRVLTSGIVGFMVGGISGFVLSFIFIITPLQDVLGPRYSEFDFFGVLVVTVLASIAAPVVASVAGIVREKRAQSTYRKPIWFILAVVPFVLLIVLAHDQSGEWAWVALTHLAVCFGTFAGVASQTMLMRKHSASSQQQADSP